MLNLLLFFSLALSAFAQSIQIYAPTAGQALAAGSNVIVTVNKPVRFLQFTTSYTTLLTKPNFSSHSQDPPTLVSVLRFITAR